MKSPRLLHGKVIYRPTADQKSLIHILITRLETNQKLLTVQSRNYRGNYVETALGVSNMGATFGVTESFSEATFGDVWEPLTAIWKLLGAIGR